MTERNNRPRGQKNRRTTAVIPVLFLMVAGLSITPTAAAGDYSCSDSHDDDGFGGSTITCEYECRTGSTLSVKASGDKDAILTGNTSCGSATASCSAKGSCTSEPSASTTSSGSGDCKGASDEFWSSRVSVSCAATGSSDPPGEECPLDDWVKDEIRELVCEEEGGNGSLEDGVPLPSPRFDRLVVPDLRDRVRFLPAGDDLPIDADGVVEKIASHATYDHNATKSKVMSALKTKVTPTFKDPAWEGTMSDDDQEFILETLSGLDPRGSSAHIIATGAGVVAYQCNGLLCQQAPVDCYKAEGRHVCVTGAF